jgi:ribonuclease P protein component
MKHCRLYKNEILRKKKVINQIFTSARILSSPNLVMRYVESPSRKIGFIIKKDIVPKAVMRNKLKRYLREIYRNHKEYFNEQYSYIIQTRANATKIHINQMREEFLSLAQRVNNAKN